MSFTGQCWQCYPVCKIKIVQSTKKNNKRKAEIECALLEEIISVAQDRSILQKNAKNDSSKSFARENGQIRIKLAMKLSVRGKSWDQVDD